MEQCSAIAALWSKLKKKFFWSKSGRPYDSCPKAKNLHGLIAWNTFCGPIFKREITVFTQFFFGFAVVLLVLVEVTFFWPEIWENQMVVVVNLANRNYGLLFFDMCDIWMQNSWNILPYRLYSYFLVKIKKGVKNRYIIEWVECIMFN